MKKVLVLCTGNSCRSQIAHGLLNYLTGNTHEIYSAGINNHSINPRAIKTMSQAGIDISFHTSNDVNDYLAIDFDYVITVCDNANQTCPTLSNAKAVRIHQNIEDPSKIQGSDEEIETAFRNARESILKFCKEFCKNYLAD